ncbi:hypothetical protein Lfu02_23800 [Longispora fulva]|uniref:DUF3566 domain-containing protein n=1 Tax=Longispora fulva TaxID=619741 RepID=A0A8J7GU89_9ACTN|nr:DUF3566 domain-containing protein [Longispora fulva]MBG6139610.1 hypothetical protein [Longispora fulva]GIG58008.1 hypothetical protein Lfu02_23800 [Longispora fulva]
MTETQAKSSASTGSTGDPGTARLAAEPSETGGAAGRAAVGRATVPGEAAPSTAKFTRPPGMNPPPDTLPGAASVAAPRPVSAVPAGSPVPAPGAKGPVAEAVRAARATVSAAASRGPRRARLHLKRIDPWSVMKFSFAVSVVLFIVMVVATAVLYLALDAMGVFDTLNKTLASLIGSAGDTKGASFKITALGVIGTAAVLGVVNMVLFTALSTLGSFIYNVCADLVGGVELTLSEKE